MKLYKQKSFKKNGEASFSLYEIVINGTELLIRSGTCGRKIKESIKPYESEKDVLKAYKKMFKSKLKSGFFECEGDDDNPALQPPFGLGSAPADFSVRISQLADIGVYLSPDSHKRYEFEDILPLYSISLQYGDETDLVLIRSIIEKTNELKETLMSYRDQEMDLHEFTNDKWETELISNTERYFSYWKIVDNDNINLGLIREVGGIDSADLFIDIIQNKNKKCSSHLVELCVIEDGYYGTQDEILDMYDIEYDSDIDLKELPISDVAKVCAINPSKSHAELLNWLFSDVSISVHEVTTSSFYAAIDRPQAISIYLIKHKPSQTAYVYFYELFFEC